MKRSIRRTLLLGYLSILAAALGSMAVWTHEHQRRVALEAVDRELDAHARALANAVEWDVPEGFEFELRPEYRALFEGEDPATPYFVVAAADGTVLARSRGAREEAAPPPAGGARREARVRAAGDTTVLVGRRTPDVAARLAALRRGLALAGLFAMALATLGGLWLAHRVLAPLARISETASRLSATRLDERIDVAETESELGRLAETLNATFDRLADAVERERRFTADASHELRTPLAVLRVGVDWALGKERSPAEYREALEGCRRATDRMESLTEGLLALAREASETDARPVDLADVAQDALHLLDPLVSEGGARVEKALEPARVRGVPSALATVATSLIANALLHGAGATSIRVTTGTAAGDAYLRVEDDGPGIAAEHLPHVFERFYRADASRSRRRGGSGLGLAIARRIVEAHGGRIEALSREGEGATFEVHLGSV